MNLEDLAAIMGKSVPEVEKILKSSDVVDVSLNEASKNNRK